MMCLELISEFDLFLAEHIAKSSNKGKGFVSYHSFATYEEFIKIMGEKVIKFIVQELKVAKYYSISVDSMPDLSHVDQLSFIVQYVKKDGTPVEHFLHLIPNVGHKSEVTTSGFDFTK